MSKFGDLDKSLVCRYSSSIDEESGEERRNGDDTLMNKYQTICYFGDFRASLETFLNNGYAVGKKIKDVGFECTKNGWIIPVELVCEEQQKAVSPVENYEQTRDNSGDLKDYCAEEGDLSCALDGVDYVGQTDEATILFCESNGGELNDGDITDFYENYLGSSLNQLGRISILHSLQNLKYLNKS
ncbi:MAG: hypothetical protein Q9M94_04570 [Candidatus Gracilibacteria bacterium]|nr:hypothetical protein [Candidatus Gracilibacteria bacterium]